MKDLKCPYCGEDLEVCHDDGDGYEQDVLHEMECGNCEKSFVFYTNISFSYEPFKADCLNDGRHVYKPTITYPKEATRMRCNMCDEERQPTEDEWKEIYKNTKK